MRLTVGSGGGSEGARAALGGAPLGAALSFRLGERAPDAVGVEVAGVEPEHSTCPSETTNLHVNGLDFNVREIGSTQPALVFIHYWGGTGRTRDLVAKSLSERHRCIAPDLRGWGGSDRMAMSYDLHVQADDIAAIVQSLGLSHYILVGHSMGGKIAQILASRRPTGLKGLVLVGPAPPTPLPVPEEQKKAILDSYQTPAGTDFALSVITEKKLSPGLRKQVVEDSLGGAPAAKSAWTEQGMALDIGGLVGTINVPTTVILGNADKVEHEDVLRRELASRIKGTEFIILPGVGHLSPLEAPAEVAAAITKAISNIR